MLAKIVVWTVFILTILYTAFDTFTTVKMFILKKNKRKSVAIKYLSKVLAFASIISVYSYTSFVNVDKQTQANAIKGYSYQSDGYVADNQLLCWVVNDIENTYWNKIPASTREVLKNDWTTIYDVYVPSAMVPKVSIGRNTYDKSGLSLGGLTLNQKRLLFVNIGITDYDAFINTFIHEHGHAVSYEYGTLHGSIEWIILYNENKDKIVCDESIYDKDYYTSDAAEFFAWSYSEYFVNQEELKENMPDIYEYMDQLNHTEISDYKLLTGIKSMLNSFFFYMF